MTKYREAITWAMLADEISKLSEEQKQQPVRCWGDEQPLSCDCRFNIDNEDWMQHEDWEWGDPCYLRSDCDEEEDARVVLPSGTPYICY